MFFRLINGDCFTEMDRLIAEGTLVDAIICDLPYGTSDCRWDEVLPFPYIWERTAKIIRPGGMIALFGSEPFSSKLRVSNIKHFKYDWVWEKEQASNFALMKYQPARVHEVVSVFSSNSKKITYYPQKTPGKPYVSGGGSSGDCIRNGMLKKIRTKNTGDRFPRSIQKFNTDKRKAAYHPTQKPVKLLELLVKTYTKEGEVVLDFTAGAFSTGVACFNTQRSFIGIELNTDYYMTGVNRIKACMTDAGYSPFFITH